MAELTKVTEYENNTIRLVKLGGLHRHPNFPRGLGRSAYVERKGRTIRKVFVHHLAGSFKRGLKNATALANWISSDPIYAKNPDGTPMYRTVRGKRKPKRIGGGRGWPGVPYTFLVPFWPEMVDGLLEVYRMWDDPWHTWHTSKHWNRDSVAVGCGGSMNTRHAPKWSERARDPEATQFVALQSLVMDYLLPRYGLTAEDDLMGHFDAGKPACPGDVLEAWVRTQRGEEVDWIDPARLPWETETEPRPEPVLSRRTLDTWEKRQQALIDLGYDLGHWGADGEPGYYTRMAVESFQENAGIIVDGIWGPQTQKWVLAALAVQPAT